jgi:hypothetical protein
MITSLKYLFLAVTVVFVPTLLTASDEGDPIQDPLGNNVRFQQRELQQNNNEEAEPISNVRRQQRELQTITQKRTPNLSDALTQTDLDGEKGPSELTTLPPKGWTKDETKDFNRRSADQATLLERIQNQGGVQKNNVVSQVNTQNNTQNKNNNAVLNNQQNQFNNN